MNPKSTDCEADALTTTLSRRSDMKRSVQDLVIVYCCNGFAKSLCNVPRLQRRRIAAIIHGRAFQFHDYMVESLRPNSNFPCSQ